MNRQKLLWLPLLFLFCGLSDLFAQVQVPQVGNTLDFAGMKLHLTEQARRDIQSSVDAIYRSEKFFNLRLEQVDLYMPLIEPVFEKYGVPEEFKYLVIQESGLVPDAVSSSNAVGFWQFKEESATELDMRVDRQVDERMNIVSATEGAAKYLLRSNAEFDNWVYSLQSYMVGQGGTSRSVNKRHYGAREMKIDGDTHWYIKKFLSHLVAYENVTGKQTRYTVLYPYTNGANKSLRQIAREFDTTEEELQAYNKWLKTSSIPDDKTYTVIIPVKVDQSQDLLAMTTDGQEEAQERARENEAFGHKQQKPGKLPAVSTDRLAVVELNDLEGVIAREGDQLASLADLGGISEKRFRKYNDLAYSEKIVPGQFYYLEKKRRRARVYEHVLQPGESLWQVSQQYGVRLKKLRQKNRLAKGEEPKAGRVLWLRFIRPERIAVEYREIKKPKTPLYASTKSKANPTTNNSLSENEAIPPVEAAEVAPVKTNPEEIGTAEPKETQKESENKRKAAKQAFEEKKTMPSKQEAASSPTSTQYKNQTSAYSGSISTPTGEEPTKEKEDAGRHLMQADTPVTQKSPIDTLPVEDTKATETPKNHILSEPGSSQRKVQEEKKEKAPVSAATYPSQSVTPADSFAVEEEVTFIDAEPQPQQQADSIHTVQAGETLYSLSRQYGVSVQDLIRWNKLPNQPVLSIGQVLWLREQGNAALALEEESAVTPVAENSPSEEEQEVAASAERQYHTVAPGESMYRVARMYNVTIKDIMRWNNKENFDLKEGERLVVGTK